VTSYDRSLSLGLHLLLAMDAQLSSPTTSQPAALSKSQPQPQPPPQAQPAHPPPPPPPRADATSPFLRDFNLVAEAAKRAQMAVLMRDLEAVGI
jgi:hypothetical protein